MCCRVELCKELKGDKNTSKESFNRFKGTKTKSKKDKE